MIYSVHLRLCASFNTSSNPNRKLNAPLLKYRRDSLSSVPDAVVNTETKWSSLNEVMTFPSAKKNMMIKPYRHDTVVPNHVVPSSMYFMTRIVLTVVMTSCKPEVMVLTPHPVV